MVMHMKTFFATFGTALRATLTTLLAVLRALLGVLAASISVSVLGLGSFQARGLVGVIAVVVIIYLLTGSPPQS
jgi:hypothetical protein